MNALTVVLCALVVSGCVVRNNCTPRNCDGCCDATGLCRAGNSAAACGAVGSACTACEGLKVCQAGACASLGGTAGGAPGGSPTDGGVSGQRFSVTLLWNFAGATCAQAGVSTVTVSMPGVTLANNGVFPCSFSGTDGVALVGITPGTYPTRLEGRDASGAVSFRTTQGLTVALQDLFQTVRLDPLAATGPGDLLVRWRFPPLSVATAPTCAQATIAKVKVAVNGGTAREVDCSTGEPSGAGLRLPNLSGTVSLAVTAADSTGFVYFAKTDQVPVPAGASTPVTVLLDWDVGSLPTKWTFTDAGLARTCAQLGITRIFLNLRTPAGTFVYPGTGVDVPCDDPTSGQGAVFPYLTQGTYDVFFQAVAMGGRLFKTDQAAPPQVTVRAGQFPVLDAQTRVFTLTP